MELLRDYKRIAFDFDETLIDHDLSERFWKYISDNPLGQEFHIVTFRSGGMENRVWDDLRYRGSKLTEEHFKGFHHCPHELWREFHYGGDEIMTPGGIFLPSNNPDHPYLCWKGAICADHGLEVLIDDMPSMVLAGCKKYRIDYIHPDDLFE